MVMGKDTRESGTVRQVFVAFTTLSLPSSYTIGVTYFILSGLIHQALKLVDRECCDEVE
jgi:hypothetical protein